MATKKIHPFVKFMDTVTQEAVAKRLGTPQSTVSYQYRMCQQDAKHQIPAYYVKVVAQMSNNRFTSKHFAGLTRELDIRRAA